MAEVGGGTQVLNNEITALLRGRLTTQPIPVRGRVWGYPDNYSQVGLSLKKVTSAYSGSTVRVSSPPVRLKADETKPGSRDAPGAIAPTDPTPVPSCATKATN